MVEGITTEVKELSSAVSVLSAMITPAILILASGSLLATTSARLIRVIDRVRELSAEIRSLADEDSTDPRIRETRELFFDLLNSASRRARILQRSMTRLYLSISALILTTIAIGILSLSNLDLGWLALGIGLVGVILLLDASIHLIFESRMALYATRQETRFVQRWGHHFLEESRGQGER